MRTKSSFVLAVVVVLLTITPTLFGQPIDFENLHIASRTYGRVAGQGTPRLMAAYSNKIYFIVMDDGTSSPSKVCCYNPSDGLFNGVNHSIVLATTGSFVTLRRIGSLLWFSDNLGHVYCCDGSSVAEMGGTPFTASDYVSSIEKFKGLVYLGTYRGNIFRYDGLTFERVCEISEDRRIMDMAAWQQDGYLYVSVGPDKVICCPPLGYAIRSSSADADSWETVLGGNYYSMLFMPTADYLYTAVMDTAYCHCSTIRKSAVGTTFPVIYPSDGQYKVMWGSLYYDGIAYFFADDSSYGYPLGETIVDDNGSVNRIVNQKWQLTQAVELNDEIYALASSTAGSLQGDVYLITTASDRAIEATVDIDPRVLNLNSEGKWVTCYVELPEGYDVRDIDVGSVLLEGLLGVQRSDIQDAVLMVKFDREALATYLDLLGVVPPVEVELVVTGNLTGGRHFEGSDTILARIFHRVSAFLYRQMA